MICNDFLISATFSGVALFRGRHSLDGGACLNEGENGAISIEGGTYLMLNAYRRKYGT